MTITSAADGAKLALEQDMLDVAKRPENDREIVEQLKVIGDAWWDQNQIEPILRSWTNFFSSEGEYQHLIDRQAIGADKPLVYFAPALILRKRTPRTLIHVFDSIAEQLKGGDESSVPVGVKSVVTTLPISSQEEGDEQDVSDKAASNIDSEIYFPLPYNEQQKRIVDKFNANHGVVVQGPPGTGKSQTIANLICHLLASGKRILITSQTARALQSLSDKIPEEVQALCVSLLGNDRKAYEGLEESIVGITNRYNSWDRSANRKQIEEFRRRLHESRVMQARVISDLRTLREAEITEHQAPFGDYKGKLSEIARTIAQQESQYGWVSEFLSDVVIDLTNADLLTLLGLLGQESTLIARGLVSIPFEISSIPTTEQFGEIVDAEVRSLEAAAKLKELRGKREFEKLRSLDQTRLQSLATGIRQLRSRLSKGKTHIHKWAEQVFVEVLGEKDRAWRILLQQTDSGLEKVKPLIETVSRYRVVLPNDFDSAKAFTDVGVLIQHFAEGGKLQGFFGKPKIVKQISYIFEQVRIDGKPISKDQDAKKLLDWLSVQLELKTLQELWEKIAKVTISSFAGTVAEFEDLCEPLREAVELHASMTHLRDQLIEIGEIEIPVWYDLGELDKFCQIFDAIESSSRHEQASLKVLEVSRVIAKAYEGKARPEQIDRLLTAISERDLSNFRKCYFEISDLVQAGKELSKLRRLEQSLKNISPSLVRTIRASHQDPIWETRLSDFNNGWKWAQTDQWLSKFSDPSINSKLTRELEEARKSVSGLIRDLSVSLAWGHFFDRLTENERQNLIAWARNMQKIGKGTGKYVGKHRDAARKNMEQCRSAIPAWIMPIYRIAETLELTFPPKNGHHSSCPIHKFKLDRAAKSERGM